jgi:hypothetical protein
MAVTPDQRPAEETTPASDRNEVDVEFADGTQESYAVVVCPADGDWLHAERLVGDADGLNDEEFESLNADAIRRIRSDRVHVRDGGTVHVGDGLLVDPDRLAAEYGLA